MALDHARTRQLGIASELLVETVPHVHPAATATEIRQLLVGPRWAAVADVVVTDGDRLVGLIRLEDLLAAPGESQARELMDADPPCIGPGIDQEVAAWKAVHHAESSLAVVDDEHRFLGLIPPHRLLEVLLEEHDEDLARLGGFLHVTEVARRASEESVLRRLRHRLPWLMLGLAATFAAAAVVAAFEVRLQSNLTLAFFLPGIVYMADAVGTQTETLVVRGLSVGVPIAAVIRRELLTGVLIGVLLAMGFFPVAVGVWGDRDVAVAVAIALAAASACATGVAMTLPALLSRLGLDPAFGSGPLATVVQDLLTIVIYFALASAIVT
jgi:magnesium transporter